ncbi:MAG: hypothetical protein JRG96_14235 [Deltaproteobacteria bacterium]|nr:hypothetical protein [Deltaproteobacteria bacterium]MBW2418258.1 hypothetical protein [Deltaproteobacteria bacterium]
MHPPHLTISLILALTLASSSFANDANDANDAGGTIDADAVADAYEAYDDAALFEQFAAYLDAATDRFARGLVSEQLEQQVEEIEVYVELALAGPRLENMDETPASIPKGPRYVVTIRDEWSACGARSAAASCASVPETAQASVPASHTAR